MAENSDVHVWIPEACSSSRFVLLTFPQRITISMEQSSSLKINTNLTGKYIHPHPRLQPPYKYRTHHRFVKACHL